MMIMITGGAGYIGSHICVELLNSGYGVVVYDNFCTSRRSVVPRIEQITGKKLNHVCGDIRHEQLLTQILIKYNCDAIIHCAGLKSISESWSVPLTYYDTNLVGSVAVLRAMHAAQVQLIVFSSSATVYGVPKKLPISEEHTLHANNPYGRSKFSTELLLQDYCQSYAELKLAILRYFNPVGSHESGLLGDDPICPPKNLMPIVAKVASGREPLLNIWGDDYPTPDGTAIRDYIHVIDLAKGHVKALECLDKIGTFTVNLGTGRGYSVFEVLNTFTQVSGQSIAYKIMPRRAGDVAECYADPSRALKLLGWQAKLDLDTMCSSAWMWEKQQYS